MGSLATGAVVILGICVLFLVGVVIADTDGSAGPQKGVTLNTVVEQPSRYDGDRVTVSGEWAETEYFSPDEAEQVIVIGNDADAGYLDLGGLLAEGDGPAPIVAAERVELVAADDEPLPFRPDRVTVAQLVRGPRAFNERALLVSGTVTKLGGRGFLLRNGGRTIFVSAPGSELELPIESGEPYLLFRDLA